MKVRAWLLGTLLVLASAPLGAATLVFIALGPANRILAVDAARHAPVQSLLGVANARAVVAGDEGLLVAGSFNETNVAGKRQGELYVIDPAHGHAVLTLPVAGRIHAQAIAADGRSVISTHPTWNGISIFDLRGLQIVRYLKTGNEPTAVAVRRLEPRAYVSNAGDGLITEIDTREWRIVRQWDQSAGPRQLLINREETRLLVGEPEQGTVALLDLEAGKLDRRVRAGKGFHSLALGDDSRSLYISGPGNQVRMLDIETGATRDAELGAAPGHVNVISGTGVLYVASREQPVIWVLNQRDLELVETIELPAGEGFQVAMQSGVAMNETPSAALGLR
ncbi:MAG: YncE family protein [Thiohalomonadaceae bacterium]